MAQKKKDIMTSWEELGISNDFLFGKIMEDRELCKELLQRILPELDIDHVEYPELQKTIQESGDAKGVRLDVYVNDGKGTVYNIEMQAGRVLELPQRSRYYQGMIDLQLLDKGHSYKELPQSFVIFICLTDMFGQGRHKYTFENLCRENSSLALGDGTTKIFLNAGGTLDDVSEELKTFLDYAAGQKPKDDFARRLDEAVKKAKQNREWRREYMTQQMRDMENREIGEAIGKEIGEKIGQRQGEERMSALVKRLIGENRLEDVARATEDRDYRHRLFEQYGIV